MTSQLLAAAASVALVGAGVTGSSGVRSFEAMPTPATVVVDGEGGGAGVQCRVDVIRSGDAGTVNTTKTMLEDNSCVCTVTKSLIYLPLTTPARASSISKHRKPVSFSKTPTGKKSSPPPSSAP